MDLGVKMSRTLPPFLPWIFDPCAFMVGIHWSCFEPSTFDCCDPSFATSEDKSIKIQNSKFQLFFQGSGHGYPPSSGYSYPPGGPPPGGYPPSSYPPGGPRPGWPPQSGYMGGPPQGSGAPPPPSSAPGDMYGRPGWPQPPANYGPRPPYPGGQGGPPTTSGGPPNQPQPYGGQPPYQDQYQVRLRF